MGCAPVPKKNENIPKLNAEPQVIKKEVTSIEKLVTDDSKIVKVRFEDIANNDITIKEERRANTDIRAMDFVNKEEIIRWILIFIPVTYLTIHFQIEIQMARV